MQSCKACSWLPSKRLDPESGIFSGIVTKIWLQSSLQWWSLTGPVGRCLLVVCPPHLCGKARVCWGLKLNINTFIQHLGQDWGPRNGKMRGLARKNRITEGSDWEIFAFDQYWQGPLLWHFAAQRVLQHATTWQPILQKPNVRIPGKTTTAYYGKWCMSSYLIHTYDLCIIDIIDLPGLMAGLYFPSLSISFFNLFSHFWRFG